MIAKNWKKILIIIGAVILAILLFYKITWKPNVIEDYNNSNIEIKRDVIDGIKKTTNDVSNDANEYLEEVDNKSDQKIGSRSVVGWIIILAVIVFAILILDMFMQPSDDKKKKK